MKTTDENYKCIKEKYATDMMFSSWKHIGPLIVLIYHLAKCCGYAENRIMNRVGTTFKSKAMKKSSFIIVLCFFLSIVSSERIDAQTGRIDPCPPGYCQVGVSFVIDQFNFHKPRTDCESRFGICLRGHMEAECAPCWSVRETSYKDGKVTGWFKISDKKIELHLPLALGQSKGFINEDMSIFYVDDDTVTILNSDGSHNCKLKGGEYTVTISGNDYVILIDVI